MDNLYNSDNLCRYAYAENKLVRGVARTHGQGVLDEIIQQGMKSKKKQDEARGEVKVAVMKGDTTCPDMLVCILFEKNLVHIISPVD